jgi:hypothetical protein
MTRADEIFACVLFAAEEYRTFTPTEVIAAGERLSTVDVPNRRTVTDHCNNLAEIGILRTVESGRWKFIDRYDPS